MVYPSGIFKLQSVATLSQANPVSTTLYTVLDTTENVIIYHIQISLTWATTQPNPLVVIITVDGQTLTFSKSNPVSNQDYNPNYWDISTPGGGMDTSSGNLQPFVIQGKSVKVQAKVTWATTQPNPMTCRVLYGKLG